MPDCNERRVVTSDFFYLIVEYWLHALKEIINLEVSFAISTEQPPHSWNDYSLIDFKFYHKIIHQIKERIQKETEDKLKAKELSKRVPVPGSRSIPGL